MGWVIPAKLMRNLLGGEEVVIQSATLFKISAMVLCDCGTVGECPQTQSEWPMLSYTL